MAKLEHRSFDFEVRAKGRQLEGYAALFGVRARIGSFSEEIRAGAFGASLKARPDVLALIDHNPSQLLARTKSGTLRLSEDSRGLAFSLDVPDTTDGRDLLALAERNDLGGMSFGFQVAKGGEIRSKDLRTLTAVTLYEISVVKAFPAYQGTSVQARSEDGSGLSLALARRHLEVLKWA
jgi:uncharacterized protein